MIASFIITFRETLEALLILFIIISYLKSRRAEKLIKIIVIGSLLAIIVSIILTLLIFTLALSFNKTLFEVIGSFIAVPILTSVIYWMAKEGPRIKSKIKEKIEHSFKLGKQYIGLISLSFIVVFREAIETVLFNFPLFIRDPMNTVYGVLVGIIAGSVLSFSIVYYTRRFSLRKFFLVTSILLIFIAGGILGYGIHELIEYFEENNVVEIGIWGQYVYSIDIDEHNLLHEKNIIGSILSTMFGYATKMELLRFLTQTTYIAISLYFIIRVYKNIESRPRK